MILLNETSLARITSLQYNKTVLHLKIIGVIKKVPML
jgi:hypothetical protein